MNIFESFEILKIPPDSSSEQIAQAYKNLAREYHPDKNKNNISWANEAMTRLNVAYSTIKSHKFKDADHKQKNRKPEGTNTFTEKSKVLPKQYLIEKFQIIREHSNDALYKYFQYNLYNLVRRDETANSSRFGAIVKNLKNTYHTISHYSKNTLDRELLNHFTVYTNMIYNFYLASECLNIIDSYANQNDVQAYRIFKAGDEYLHKGHKEIFFDRHNRGYFNRKDADNNISIANKYFLQSIGLFPESAWLAESRIKNAYATALKEYCDLFFE